MAHSKYQPDWTPPKKESENLLTQKELSAATLIVKTEHNPLLALLDSNRERMKELELYLQKTAALQTILCSRFLEAKSLNETLMALH